VSVTPVNTLPLEAELPVSLEAPASRASSGRQAPFLLAAPALATAVLVSLPLLYIFVRSAQGGLSLYLETVFSSATLALTSRTLALVVGVVAVSVAISLPAAWLVTRTDLPGRRGWAVLAALPLVFPSYVAAFTLIAALGPRGYLQGWLAPLGVERLPEIAYGYSGAVLSPALFNYPYVYLLLVVAFLRLDPAMEEGSRNLGAGRWRTFAGVTLPQLRPALYGGSLLVCLYTLSDFGAVSLVRYDTFTLSIYNAYRSLFDRTVAASLATVLVILTVAFITLEARLLTRCRAGAPRPARQARPVPLGAWRWPALASLGALVAITLGIPMAVITGWALRSTDLAGSTAILGQAAASSLWIALAAAGVTVALAIPIAAWSVRYRSRAARSAERLAHAGYALPGLVVALSLVFFATRWAPGFYQTALLLLVAYVVRFLPEALAATRAALMAIAPAFEEAARTLGRGPLSVLGTLTLPMMRSGLLAGGGLVFLTTLKELPATLILRPIGFETLATRVWLAAHEGMYSAAALPALGLLAVSAPVMYLLIIRPALAARGLR
jgi:iron(III) transport system permease protein